MSNGATSHKPRKKKKTLSGIQQTDTNADIVSIDEHSNAVKPAFPLVAFLWPARGTTSQWVLIPLILMIVGLFRWTVGLWGYSGKLLIDNLGTLLRIARFWEAANAW
jgi:alpha-1,3-glucosyltransferase